MFVPTCRYKCSLFVIALLLLVTCHYGVALQQPIRPEMKGPSNSRPVPQSLPVSIHIPSDIESCNRRSILNKSFFTTCTSLIGASMMQLQLQPANAAIDVSGLRQAADSRPQENSIIKNQIRSYDGSEMTRIQEIQKMKAVTNTPLSDKSGSTTGGTTTNSNVVEPDDEVGIATYAYRYSTAFQPQMTKVGNYGEKLRYDDQLVGTLSSPSRKNQNDRISVSFEFPSDWLQLDRLLGGIQYVDQRNGDKLYVLKVKLPPPNEDTKGITTLPKQFFGDAIFHPRGALLRSGITVDEYKVKSSKIVSDGSISIPHRRLLIKYVTVTPNGLRTERRAIVDTYEIDQTAYMMVTSSNAVKFDANGRERETVEAIADSFRIETVA